ncbi:MAG TPA: alkaline shock response membrane anchor protein AmaP [Firmicutes bacterium]|jgi:uncharacterized alkaline shock family protein YloU|nr:alkaline shock response membrane anchor protein AmaP [Bacillota bacterium]
MRIQERLSLLLLALIFTACAAVLGGAALSLPFQEALRTSIGTVYGRLEFTLLAVLLLAVAVYFLLSAIRVSEPVQSITQIAALGEIRISFKAVESLVTRAAYKVRDIRDIKVRIRQMEHGLVIFLQALAMPDRNIPQVTAELQEVVKEYVENATSSRVAEVRVLIDNIAGDVVKVNR